LSDAYNNITVAIRLKKKKMLNSDVKRCLPFWHIPIRQAHLKYIEAETSNWQTYYLFRRALFIFLCWKWSCLHRISVILQGSPRHGWDSFLKLNV